MNRINHLFETRSGGILSIYFTAGYPGRNDTAGIIRSLAGAGADMIEIGIPFSDPMADGPVIQHSSDKALRNGMSLKLLFDQIRNIRSDVDIPLLLMGYLNPVLQYGLEQFCADCEASGIDGLILPDLPLEVYLGESGLLQNNPNNHNHHNNHNNHNPSKLFSRHNLHNIFLISPQTGTDRIRKIDDAGKGFIYMVSSSSTTGVKGNFSEDQTGYFKRVGDMQLKNPRLIGFGISSRENFVTACTYAQGAIIGSAFVKMLGAYGYSDKMVKEFVGGIK
jgi:tryptophan synthase alpha chain